MNFATSRFSRPLSFDSDSAADNTCEEALPVSEAPRCTSEMLAATWPLRPTVTRLPDRLMEPSTLPSM